MADDRFEVAYGVRLLSPVSAVRIEHVPEKPLARLKRRAMNALKGVTVFVGCVAATGLVSFVAPELGFLFGFVIGAAGWLVYDGWKHG